MDKHGGMMTALPLFFDVQTIADENMTYLLEDGEEGALQPETAQIVAFSYYPRGKNGVISGACTGIEFSEETLITRFAQLLQDRSPVIVWSRFDLDVMRARAAYHGVVLPRLLDMRPWGNEVILLKYQRNTKKSLKWHAAALGITNNIPNVDGSMIAKLYEDAPEKVLGYSKNNVHILIALYNKWAQTRAFVRDIEAEAMIRKQLEAELPQDIQDTLKKENG